MYRVSLIFSLAVALLAAPADAGRCRRNCCPQSIHYHYHGGGAYAQHKAVRGDDGIWPDDPIPEPGPEPGPLPDPQPQPDPLPGPEPPPLPEPIPDPLPEPTPTPQPDPEPLPPEPEPAPPEPSIPSDPSELNTYVAQHLGGYVRANHQRGNVVVPIYQARGRQRICWANAAEVADWPIAVITALQLKSRAAVGAPYKSIGGVVLVCNQQPTPEPEPIPEPQPNPDPTPIPEPEPLPEPEPADPVLRRHGGPDLDAAAEVCRAAGLWLVVVHRYGGDVNYVIYNPPAEALKRGR